MAATAAMTFSLQSCEWFKTGRGGAGDSLAVQPYCTVSFHDSVTVVESTAYQEMHIDFPAEEDTSAVSQAVLSWLCEKVRSCCFPDYVGDSAVAVYTPDPVNATFAEDYVDTYARKGLERMAAEMRSMAEDGFNTQYLNSLEISLEEQTNDYLAFTLGYEVYTGGAHGGFTSEGATFFKRDGRKFGWDFFDKEKRSELIELIKPELKAYFSSSEEEITTDSALFDVLTLFDNPDTQENELEFGLPLPATEPWLTKKGVSFIYQQYEIAPYAAGLPNLVLPLETVKHCLTGEARAYLGL